jgi:catechol 2,3-dioxygenase-like lactoylglutathione lyase family enzyme
MAVPPIAPFGVHHVAVQCRDLAAMVRFYERVLRLRIERRWPRDPALPHGPDRSVWLRTGTTVVALEACDGMPQPPPWRSDAPGLHLLAFEIPWQNRAVWRDHLRHCGVALVFESPWTLYVCDPEGNRIGLSHFPYGEDGAVAQGP